MKCPANKDFAVLIIDVSVAFMHADIEEEIKVKVPAGIESAAGIWRLLKALNGTQKASQSWCEHSANIVTGWDASRNDYSGAVFRLENENIGIEQHGDCLLYTSPSPRDA